MNNIIDKLFDENDNDNVFLATEMGELIEFEQVALFPDGNDVFAILKPVKPFRGMGEDDGIVFKVETNGFNSALLPVFDEETIDRAFDIYYTLVSDDKPELTESRFMPL